MIVKHVKIIVKIGVSPLTDFITFYLIKFIVQIVSTNEVLSKNFVSGCLYIGAPGAPLWVRLR